MPINKHSRFHGTRVTGESEETYVEWNPITFVGPVNELVHTVSAQEATMPYLISELYYGGSPDLWWMILSYNDISDPFSLTPGDQILIPSSLDATRAITRSRAVGALTLEKREADYRQPVLNFQQAAVTNFNRLRAGGENSVALMVPGNTFSFGFPVGLDLEGNVHYQIQVSKTEEFDLADIVLSRITYSTQDRWFYFDPQFNNQTGGFRPFPAEGIDGRASGLQTVYYHVSPGDSLIRGNQYWFRYRAWIDQRDGEWYAPTSVIFNLD